MSYVLLVLAIIALMFGHYFKIVRQSQFIDIYEKPNKKVLLQALIFGYVFNFFVPFRLGDFIRAWYSGKRTKNGVSFTLSTIIMDRFLDIIVVFLIFLIINYLNVSNNFAYNSMLFYCIIAIVLIILLFLIVKFNKLFKKIVRIFASVFNDYFQLKILIFFWCMITSFKDIINKINKDKILFNTIIMWTFYIASYYLFALSAQNFGYNMSLSNILITLFARNSFDFALFSFSNMFLNKFSILLSLYIFIPLILLLIYSKFMKDKVEVNSKHLQLLPQLRVEDKLSFLESYFDSNDRNYFKYYLLINSDINIIQDYSAGSNATTILCTDNINVFFRKYSIGKDYDKLYEQASWLERYKDYVKLAGVSNIKKSDGYCCYDMNYHPSAKGCFNYVHSVPTKQAWKLVKKVLVDLNKNLYSIDKRKSDKQSIDIYIDNKVLKNIEKIENGIYIKPLLKYSNVIINGRQYHNLNYYKKCFTKEYLYKVFEEDEYSVIHGDLTIENIICLDNDYYLIDPNPNNVHDSCNLDYAKLLQSIHGNYEFYMNTSNVQVYENNIGYLFTKSSVYDKLLQEYKNYLFENFSEKQVKSIFFHEIVHWFRLMPYKIEKNKERSVLFYAAMIIVINDVFEMFGEK